MFIFSHEIICLRFKSFLGQTHVTHRVIKRQALKKKTVE
jgi:hypothetical protein